MAVALLEMVGVGVVPAEGNSILTEALPTLQFVTLHAVICTVTVSLDVNVAASDVEPAGDAAGTPFTVQRVVVYVPETVPVQVMPAVFGESV